MQKDNVDINVRRNALTCVQYLWLSNWQLNWLKSMRLSLPVEAWMKLQINLSFLDVLVLPLLLLVLLLHFHPTRWAVDMIRSRRRDKGTLVYIVLLLIWPYMWQLLLVSDYRFIAYKVLKSFYKVCYVFPQEQILACYIIRK